VVGTAPGGVVEVVPAAEPEAGPDRPRATGRPRDPKVDAAILGATLELLAAGGYEALSIEAVAAAAGVGKASVYRRFAGKEQLVVEAVASLIEPVEPPAGSSVRDELVALLEAVRRKSASSLADKIFPGCSARRRQPRADGPLPRAGHRPARRRFLTCSPAGVRRAWSGRTSTSTTPPTCSSARWPTATSSAPTRRPAPSSPPGSSTTCSWRWHPGTVRRTRRTPAAPPTWRPVTDRAAPAPVQLTHRQVLTVLSGLLLGMFLAALDQTVVSTAMRTIADELEGQTAQAWVTTSYLIASTITTPLYGKLSDQYGRKPFYLFAISVFVLGSVLCGTAQSIYELAAYRAVQGIGAGGPDVAGLRDRRRPGLPAERGRYQGWFMAVFGTSSVLGPVIGGAFAGQSTLLGIDGWRWIFYVNVPIGLVALLVVMRTLHLPHEPAEHRIDFLGAGLLSAAVVPLLLVAEKGREWGWELRPDAGPAGLSAVSLVGFVLVERRMGTEAILPLKMFVSSIFSLTTVTALLIGAGMFGGMVVLPLYLQIVKGSSPTEAGLQLIPLMIGIIVTSAIAGRVMGRTGRYKVFPVGRHRADVRRADAHVHARGRHPAAAGHELHAAHGPRARPEHADAGDQRAERHAAQGHGRRHQLGDLLPVDGRHLRRRRLARGPVRLAGRQHPVAGPRRRPAGRGGRPLLAGLGPRRHLGHRDAARRRPAGRAAGLRGLDVDRVPGGGAAAWCRPSC
jgi:MFS family permease